MNRADKRRKKREASKKVKAIRNLTNEQTKIVADAVNNINERYKKELADIVDRSLSAALILNDMSMKQANKVCKDLIALMEEDNKKYRYLNKKFSEGEFELYMKKINEEVKQTIEEMLDKGATKKQAIEELAFKFPQLSKSMLTNTYHQIVKEQKQKKEGKDPEVESAVEYVFEEDKKDVKSKPKKASQKKQDKGLKIKSMVVEGENGIYKICDKGVELQKNGLLMSFENVQQLESFTDEYKKVFEMIK